MKINNLTNIEEDTKKSPSLSPTSPKKASVAVSKLPSDIVSNNDVVVSETTAADPTTKDMPAVEETTSSFQSSLTNGKGPQVNGVAPVRHENGSNKTLTVEIDIPPGMWLI